MFKEKLTNVLSGKDSKKGFTLVELIIVLVILAVLAAILVPALLGFVDKANDKQSSLDAKAIYEATIVYIDEQYGKGIIVKNDSDSKYYDKATEAKCVEGTDLSGLKDCTDAYDEIGKIAGFTVTGVKVVEMSNGNITKINLKFTDSKGNENTMMTYDGKEWKKLDSWT